MKRTARKVRGRSTRSNKRYSRKVSKSSRRFTRRSSRRSSRRVPGKSVRKKSRHSTRKSVRRPSRRSTRRRRTQKGGTLYGRLDGEGPGPFPKTDPKLLAASARSQRQISKNRRENPTTLPSSPRARANLAKKNRMKKKKAIQAKWQNAAELAQGHLIDERQKIADSIKYKRMVDNFTKYGTHEMPVPAASYPDEDPALRRLRGSRDVKWVPGKMLTEPNRPGPSKSVIRPLAHGAAEAGRYISSVIADQASEVASLVKQNTELLRIIHGILKNRE